MKSNYLSNLSSTLLKRISGDPELPRIECLDLTNGFISPSCLILIAKSISQYNQEYNVNGALFEINLGRNQICGIDDRGEGIYDPSGLICLIEALTPSRCLRLLNLERNYIGGDSCAALATLLEARNPLSQLILKGCSLTSADLTKLVAKMKKNTHLQILNLSGNFLCAAGVVSLGKALSDKRCVLHYLDLSCNGFGEDEAESLIGVMKENHSIATLILDDNELGDEGARHIGTMLLKSKNLEQLSLHNNMIGHEGVRELALALEQNSKLKFLGLQWNEITNMAVEFLAKGLMKNNSLKTLALVGNDFDESRAALLLEASLISNTAALTIDVPSAPLRPTSIVVKEIETIEYYPFST